VDGEALNREIDEHDVEYGPSMLSSLRERGMRVTESARSHLMDAKEKHLLTFLGCLAAGMFVIGILARVWGHNRYE
jgi:hypothetical protein